MSLLTSGDLPSFERFSRETLLVQAKAGADKDWVSASCKLQSFLEASVMSVMKVLVEVAEVRSRKTSCSAPFKCWQEAELLLVEMAEISACKV